MEQVYEKTTRVAGITDPVKLYSFDEKLWHINLKSLRKFYWQRAKRNVAGAGKRQRSQGEKDWSKTLILSRCHLVKRRSFLQERDYCSHVFCKTTCGYCEVEVTRRENWKLNGWIRRIRVTFSLFYQIATYWKLTQKECGQL
jgi:hypothetical protein